MPDKNQFIDTNIAIV